MNATSTCGVVRLVLKRETERDLATRLCLALVTNDGVPKHELWSDHLDGPDVMVRNRAAFRLNDTRPKANFHLLFSCLTGRYKGPLSGGALGPPASHAFTGVNGR